MKRYKPLFKINKNFKFQVNRKYSPIFFIEGKKQATQILQKYFGEKAKEITNKLAGYDPTEPKNKYLDLFANIIKYYIEKEKRDPGYAYILTTDFLMQQGIIDELRDIEKRNLKVDFKFTKPEDLLANIKKATSTITKSKAKEGLKGLKKNVDYIEIPLKTDKSDAYIPLNYKASRVLASNRVGQCEGKWCTAYQKDDDYWDDYINQKKKGF